MKIQQQLLSNGKFEVVSGSDFDQGKAQLVLAFGSPDLIKQDKNFAKIKKLYPKAKIVSCSTAGQILNDRLFEEVISITAINFEKTIIKAVCENIENANQSRQVGALLAQKLPTTELVHVMVFSDGLRVNGSDLVAGLAKNLPKMINITGGLAGDNADFGTTYTGLNEVARSGKVVAIGFYGKNLKVGFGSVGGWDAFGHKRVITKSEGNTIYKLDNEPILDLYEKYLGDLAKDLPGSGLFFPLSIQAPNSKVELVRTLLSVDKKNKSITFAGDVLQGHFAQLMKANFERIIDGAASAADNALLFSQEKNPELAILVSCVGRKLLLKQRTEEELEGVQNVLGPKTRMAGFYSYGEICPTTANKNQCELHNQTMTITIFSEK